MTMKRKVRMSMDDSFENDDDDDTGLRTVTASPEHAGQRLDRVLTELLPDLSRSRLKALIEDGAVTTDGKTLTDPAKKVAAGWEIAVNIPPPIPATPIAQAMDLDIVYEDEHLLVINKPAGLTVHPAPGHSDSTLVNALLAHCGDSLSGIGGVMRPGIVHRLDKDTSGLIVVAKHDKAHASLSRQLANRSLSRIYQALVWGSPTLGHGTVTGAIGRSPHNRQKMAVVRKGGKEAVTHYKVLSRFFDAVTLVECKLETGRTHQIRVHMAHIGHPLVGDPVYGSGWRKGLPSETKETFVAFDRQALHAAEIAFIHPVTDEEMFFECPLPDDMRALLDILN